MLICAGYVIRRASVKLRAMLLIIWLTSPYDVGYGIRLRVHLPGMANTDCCPNAPAEEEHTLGMPASHLPTLERRNQYQYCLRHTQECRLFSQGREQPGWLLLRSRTQCFYPSIRAYTIPNCMAGFLRTSQNYRLR